MANNKIIQGTISVGVAHPLYNKTVALEVLSENTGYDGKHTWVRTVDEVLFENMPLLIYDKTGKFLREEVKPPYSEKCEGWLVQRGC